MVILRTKISNFTCYSSSTVLWFCLFFLLLSLPSRNFYLEEGMMLGPGKRLDPLFLCLNCAGRNRQRLSHWHFQHDSSASSVFSISIWEDQIRALSSFESRNAWSYTVPGSYLVHLRMVIKQFMWRPYAASPMMWKHDEILPLSSSCFNCDSLKSLASFTFPV